MTDWSPEQPHTIQHHSDLWKDKALKKFKLVEPSCDTYVQIISSVHTYDLVI